MKEIVESPWYSIIGFSIGIISFIVSLILYKKSKKEKRPCYNIRSLPIVHKPWRLIKDLEIEVRYKGSIIEDLIYTKLAFYNAGKETIEINDIAKNDPLVIEADDNINVYDCEIIYTSHKANNFKISWEEGSRRVFLYFDYLDYSQGAIIKIIHSGLEYYSGLKTTSLHVNGSIKGANFIEPHPSFAPTSFLIESKIFYEDSKLI